MKYLLVVFVVICLAVLIGLSLMSFRMLKDVQKKASEQKDKE